MLILHILCGFGVDEVASAFVITYTAVEKRIPRAKKVLAGSNRLFDTQAPSEFLDAPSRASKGPSICSSMRVITGHRLSLQSAGNFAKRRCG